MGSIHQIAKRIQNKGTPGLKPHTKNFLKQIVETSTLDYGLDAIAQVHKTHHLGDDLAVGCFLTGPSGAGKSTIVKAYRAAFPKKVEQTRTVKPVIYAPLKPKTSVKGMYSAVLRALGDPANTSGTELSMEQRCTTLMEKTGVELLIIDEIHHVLPGHVAAKTTTQQAADLLKSLIDTTQVPIVCVGLDHSERLLHAQITPDNPQDQLKRRFRETVCIYPFDIDDDEWLSMIDGYQKALDFKCINLTEPSIAYQLYLATNGLHGLLKNLFREALELVDQGDQITRKVLAHAYRTSRSCPANEYGNPFELSPKKLEQAVNVRVSTIYDERIAA